MTMKTQQESCLEHELFTEWWKIDFETSKVDNQFNQ